MNEGEWVRCIWDDDGFFSAVGKVDRVFPSGRRQVRFGNEIRNIPMERLVRQNKMQFLIDKSPKDVKRKAKSDLVGGQLLTPLTRYKNWQGVFAIDNGAFSHFHAEQFARLLERDHPRRSDCLFVTVPDVVGSARRTSELFEHRDRWVSDDWPIAYVAQDGAEDLPMPWGDMQALFIGGCDPWKDSKAAADLVKTARTLGIHVHVGRVNTPARFERFCDLDAQTCDGSGVARYDHMLARIESHFKTPRLLEVAE